MPKRQGHVKESGSEWGPDRPETGRLLAEEQRSQAVEGGPERAVVEVARLEVAHRRALRDAVLGREPGPRLDLAAEFVDQAQLLRLPPGIGPPVRQLLDRVDVHMPAL